jgi:hypothetical protein
MKPKPFLTLTDILQMTGYWTVRSPTPDACRKPTLTEETKYGHSLSLAASSVQGLTFPILCKAAWGVPMGAVEHFKTLCCFGLPPDAAMVAVTPLLHQIIPHGWSRFWLFDHAASFTSCYAENSEALPVGLERFFAFLDDPTSLPSLMIPAFHAKGIGWTLHRQGRGYLESGYYREVEHPIDSCWLLDAMIADTGLPFAGAALTRPRSARPFTADDVLRLDQLRPWLAHAFRRTSPFDEVPEDQELAAVGAPVLSGQAILTSDTKVVFQTPGLEQLLIILTGEPVILRGTCQPAIGCQRQSRSFSGASLARRMGLSTLLPVCKCQLSMALSRSKRSGSCQRTHSQRTSRGIREAVSYW